MLQSVTLGLESAVRLLLAAGGSMEADCTSFTATEVVAAVDVVRSRSKIPSNGCTGCTLLDGNSDSPTVVIGMPWWVGAVGGKTKLPGVLGDGNAVKVHPESSRMDLKHGSANTLAHQQTWRMLGS